jgi:hypothetical protein
MPADRVLLNLLHISDLHFGDKLRGYSVDELSAALPPLIAYFPQFDGWLGHHFKALSALHDFYKRLWQVGATSPVLITGDLTANGAVAQFDLANLYLNDETDRPNFGLGFRPCSSAVFLEIMINGQEVIVQSVIRRRGLGHISTKRFLLCRSRLRFGGD